ncbi:hypothetical protein [Sphingobium indicum]
MRPFILIGAITHLDRAKVVLILIFGIQARLSLLHSAPAYDNPNLADRMDDCPVLADIAEWHAERRSRRIEGPGIFMFSIQGALRQIGRGALTTCRFGQRRAPPASSKAFRLGESSGLNSGKVPFYFPHAVLQADGDRSTDGLAGQQLAKCVVADAERLAQLRRLAAGNKQFKPGNKFFIHLDEGVLTHFHPLSATGSAENIPCTGRMGI